MSRLSSAKYYLIVLAFFYSSGAVAAPGFPQKTMGVGSYPLTPLHAAAWFADKADSQGKRLILMVYFEGTPGWQGNVKNFSSQISNPASLQMFVDGKRVYFNYSSETGDVHILEQRFNIAKDNVFLVSGVEKGNPTVRGLGSHDLTFDSNDNPAVELVRRNSQIRVSLVGERAANKAKDEAPAELIALHRQGLALIKKSDPKSDTAACGLFRDAAERGYSPSQYSLGYCYESGRGVTHNFAAANKWYLKAAEQGHVDAQYKLGHSYRVGRGVEIDLRVALEWYKKAAENGDSDAQHNVGWMYATGQGMSTNAELAFQWFLRAAETGDVSSQFEVARRYQSGDGTPLDIQNAYYWLLILKGQKSTLAADDWKQVEAFFNSVEKDVPVEARNLAEVKSRAWLEAYSRRYLQELR